METPNFFIGGYFGAGECQRYYDHKRTADINNNNNNNQFAIEELLNFPKDEDVFISVFHDAITGNSDDSITFTAIDSCNSSVSGNEPQFSGNLSSRSLSDTLTGSELCNPYDDLAELEWLTNFGEESFSSDDLHNLQLISPTAIIPTDTSSSDTSSDFRTEPAPQRHNSPAFQNNVLVPCKARSKRSRAAPCDWTSRLLFLSRPAKSPSRDDDREFKPTPSKRRESRETAVRKCFHCGSDKTPQWRTGPMGPKTLCNACGVRFKSGRLVPEYRPASSPTYVSAKHSNSHRKVMELRRQKEVQKTQQHPFVNQRSIFDVSNGEDYLIHRQWDTDTVLHK